jgi:uncharacterized small protein (DUF1192 family)
MFDDDGRPAPKDQGFPRKLDALSIDGLKSYIDELEAEIERIRAEISKKEQLALDADKFFKK